MSKIVAKTLKTAWVVALAAVAGLNLQPYLELTRGLAQNVASVGDLPFGLVANQIPIVGPIIRLAGSVVPDVVCLAVFMLIQGLQVLPMLLANPAIVRERIAVGEQWQELPINSSDPQWLATLKSSLNNFPLLWIERIHNASRAAYCVDFFLASTAYPLFKNGWMDAIQNWSALGMGDVVWSNVPEFVVMLFAMEAAIWIYLKLCEGIDIFNAPPRATSR